MSLLYFFVQWCIVYILLFFCSAKDHNEFAIVRECIRRKLEVSWVKWLLNRILRGLHKGRHTFELSNLRFATCSIFFGDMSILLTCWKFSMSNFIYSKFEISKVPLSTFRISQEPFMLYKASLFCFIGCVFQRLNWTKESNKKISESSTSLCSIEGKTPDWRWGGKSWYLF